jgi:hypothetical protein
MIAAEAGTDIQMREKMLCSSLVLYISVMSYTKLQHRTELTLPLIPLSLISLHSA